MFASIKTRLKSWLGSCENVSPPLGPDTSRIDILMAEWGREAKRGGPGSDIAAAKALGARTAIMCLEPVQNRAIGWRGTR